MYIYRYTSRNIAAYNAQYSMIHIVFSIIYSIIVYIVSIHTLTNHVGHNSDPL